MANITSHEEPLRPTGRDNNDATYLVNLKKDLDDGSIKDEDYANSLRDRLDDAVVMFDELESDIDSVKVGRRSQHVEKANIKAACSKGRASVRYLKFMVEPNAMKTSHHVDYNAELSYIVKIHTTIIAARDSKMFDSNQIFRFESRFILIRINSNYFESRILPIFGYFR